MKKSKTAVRKSDLYGEIRSLIDAARNRVAVSVNAELTMLYWNVGHRINEEVLGNKRAAYGKQVVEELSKRLVGEFGGLIDDYNRYCPDGEFDLKAYFTLDNRGGRPCQEGMDTSVERDE